MHYNKVLYIDVETFSLDPKLGCVREIAYVKEVKEKPVSNDIKAYKVQPILHMEDKLYGDQDINAFCRDYNRKIGHPKDPDCIVPFGLNKSKPLFFHSIAALTFNLPAPQVINPADWLIGDDIIPPYRALMDLIDYLSDDKDVPGRWVLAGHNVKYDYDVLTYWAMRLLGEDEAPLLLDKFNKYVFLDTLALTRWYQYAGKLTTEKANLGDVASELNIDTSQMHTAKADVFASRQVARQLLGLPLIEDI